MDTTKELNELRAQLVIATDTLTTIAETKARIMEFYENGEQPPVEMIASGLTGAVRQAKEALRQMAEVDVTSDPYP